MSIVIQDTLIAKKCLRKTDIVNTADAIRMHNNYAVKQSSVLHSGTDVNITTTLMQAILKARKFPYQTGITKIEKAIEIHSSVTLTVAQNKTTIMQAKLKENFCVKLIS